MNMQYLSDAYVAEFNRCYPQTSVSTRWSGSPAVLTVRIGETAQEPMSIDQTINAIATFKQHGRPIDKHGRICYGR